MLLCVGPHLDASWMVALQARPRLDAVGHTDLETLCAYDGWKQMRGSTDAICTHVDLGRRKGAGDCKAARIRLAISMAHTRMSTSTPASNAHRRAQRL